MEYLMKLQEEKMLKELGQEDKAVVQPDVMQMVPQ
jgi:hypothetical protein|tara:strand:+ start:274 stop:378 length:105 start_codon:yes stop_codon:yes gene_type:complete